MKVGSLLEIIAALLLFISVLALDFSILASISAGLSGVIAGGISILVIVAIGIVLDFLGVMRMRSGFNTLSSQGVKTSTGSAGALLILISPLLLLVGVAIIAVGVLQASSGLAVGGGSLITIADLIYFIGAILLAIGFYSVGSYFQNTLVEVGGILSIFLGFTRFILIFIGPGGIKNSISMGGYPYPSYPGTPQYQPQSPAYGQTTYGKPVSSSQAY
ncbi:DUF973 family protein [Sulfuracidifex tepidarius]|uniref:DUF973 family protein n=1 Tax=Sulfuracidifex tepidarius TaxID=1294262 RepID=UPI0011F346F6|nr:DUF973 family protein [Sulfuracidifex tepidarius]